MRFNNTKIIYSALYLASILLTACGGGGSSPAATPPATLQSIAITPIAPSVAIGSTIGLTATATYTDGTTANVTTAATWSSFNTAIATVGSNTGVARGVAVGNDTIFAAVGGVTSPGITLSVYNSALFSVATVTDPLAVQQWGLLNTGQNAYSDTAATANTGGTLGTDININPVYTTYGYSGKSIIVGVVDTGLEITHEDLAANVVSGGSWNFLNSTTDPTNTLTTGDHGTEVGGLIAMARNGIGGIGVASDAKLKGFNLLKSQSLANQIAALGGSTASPNSSDVAIFNQSYGSSQAVDSLVNPTVEAQYAYGTSTLRGGKGALYVKSAGNGYDHFGIGPKAASCSAAYTLQVSCQNPNFDPVNTLPYNIVMAAMGSDGTASSYSSAGSSIWASAPGGEMGYDAAALTQAGYVSTCNPATVAAGAGGPANQFACTPAMVTTDQSGCSAGSSVSANLVTSTGPFSFFNWGGTNVGGINSSCNYTNAMNGTSSAAPMMSGSIAVILEANPALTWREVKDIIAKTSVQVDATLPALTLALSDGSYVVEMAWTTNAAGFKFHNWYGFGAINVSAAVNMAKTYASGSLGTFANTGWIDSGAISLTVPDNSVAGVSVPLTVPKVGASGKVEVVQVKITTSAVQGAASLGCTNNTDGCTGDIAVELTSPSGTKSILKTIQDGLHSFFFSGMVLESNAFYGETNTGTWTVKLVDGWAGSGNQTLTDAQIRVYGH